MRPMLMLLLSCAGDPGPSAPAPTATDPTRAAALVRPLPALATPAPPAPLQLGPPGPPVLRLRERLQDAALALPPSSLPDALTTRGRFVLDAGWAGAESGRSWSVPSPIALPHAFYRDAPPGVILRRGDATLPYAPATAERSAQLDGWEIEDGRLWLSSVGDPGAADPPLVLEDRATRAAEARMAWRHSGLDGPGFVAWRTTIDGLTRDVLLLPAPASARFPVADAPPGSDLRFAFAMAPPPRPGLAGRAELRVAFDGETAWRATAETGGGFVEVRLPLPAGVRSVTLSSDPLGDPTADWAVFAEPEIVPPATEAGPRRVVLVGIDTLRPDHLSRAGYARPTSPGMDAIAAQSMVFDRAWAPAPRTRPSFRTALTGRWPLAAIAAPTLAELLSAEGFTTTGVVANVHFLPHLGMAEGSGSWHYADSADAGPQVDRALAWLAEREDEDTLLFLHLMDPHVFYVAPEPHTDRFTAGLDSHGAPDRYNRWMVEQWQQSGTLSGDTKAWMEARYDGEIAYLDGEVHRLVRALDALPGRTLVVFLSDHGEEFWEHGGYEHNHSLYDEVTRALLWIRPPGGRAGGGQVEGPASLADIVPTILDAVGVAHDARPPLDGVSLATGDAHLPAPPEARLLPIGHLMFAPERWAVVASGHKYLLETGSGHEELYDLGADPAEQHDLSGRPGADLPRWRDALSAATGFPVRSGWRVTLKGTRAPFRLTFPEPIDAAWIVDPEALRSRRANLEWGEVPPVLPDDVATLVPEDGGRTLVVTPGREGRGVLAIAGPGPDTVATVAGVTVRAGRVARLGGAPAAVAAGTLIRPTDTEAARLAELQDPDAIDALRAMGYLDAAP